MIARVRDCVIYFVAYGRPLPWQLEINDDCDINRQYIFTLSFHLLTKTHQQFNSSICATINIHHKTNSSYTSVKSTSVKISFLVRRLFGTSSNMSAAKTKAQTLIDENPVMVFSKSWCSYSRRAKQLLSETGAKFEVMELDQVGTCILPTFSAR